MFGKLSIIVAILLALAGAGISGLLWLQHHGEGQAVNLASQICGEDLSGESGCGAVNSSRYSKIAGMPLGALGLFFYLSLGLLLTLAALARPEARAPALGVGIGLLVLALLGDAVLLALQAFVLRTYCKLCLATYAINAVSLGLLLLARRSRDRDELPQRTPLLQATEGRILLAGWALGSVALAAAVAASEMSLHYREEDRAMSILGRPFGLQPTAPPPAAPAAPAASSGATGLGPQSVQAAELPLTPTPDAAQLQEQLRRAQEEAARLRETLDDPQKLEQYYADKALRAYEEAPAVDFVLQNVPVLGNPAAPIRVVEFSDFLCPHCKQLAQAFDRYLPESGGRVGVYFKNYPLDTACNDRISRNIHPGACWLALGAICAQQQGRFEPFYKRAFSAAPAAPQATDAVQLAADAGLDAAALETCLQSDAAKAQLSAEIAEAGRGDVTGTPALFINGKKLSSLNFFAHVVEQEAQRLGLPQPAQPQPAPGP